MNVAVCAVRCAACRAMRLCLVVAVAGWWGVTPSPTAAVSFQYKKIVDSKTQVPGEALKTKIQPIWSPGDPPGPGRVPCRIPESEQRLAAARRPGYARRVDRTDPPGRSQRSHRADHQRSDHLRKRRWRLPVARGPLRKRARFTRSRATSLPTIRDYQLAPTIYDGRVAYPRRSPLDNVHVATVQGTNSPTVRVDKNTPVPGVSGHTIGQQTRLPRSQSEQFQHQRCDRLHGCVVSR